MVVCDCSEDCGEERFSFVEGINVGGGRKWDALTLDWEIVGGEGGTLLLLGLCVEGVGGYHLGYYGEFIAEPRVKEPSQLEACGATSCASVVLSNAVWKAP